MKTDLPFGPLMTACGGSDERMGNFAQPKGHLRKGAGAERMVGVGRSISTSRLRVEGSSAKRRTGDRAGERASGESLDVHGGLGLSGHHPGGIVLRHVRIDAHRIEVHDRKERNALRPKRPWRSGSARRDRQNGP